MQIENISGVSLSSGRSADKYEFEKGDRLFLYTDGVTEANNMKGDLYGEDRLNNCLNGISTLVPGELLESIRKFNTLRYCYKKMLCRKCILFYIF